MRRASKSRRNASAAGRQLGLTIIELLIGVAVGLMVVAGAVKLMADTLGGNRRLLLEARVNQDLRVAADLIVRDLRRAGYWQNATSGVFSTNVSTSEPPPKTPNPYVEINLDPEKSPIEAPQCSTLIEYQYERSDDDAGFCLSGGVLMFKNEGEWKPITDPHVVTITNLSIALAGQRQVELYTFCSCLTKLTCTAPQFQPGGTFYDPTDPAIPRRPTLTVRQYDIVLAGQSTTDPSVAREIRESVRIRNDVLTGDCPKRCPDGQWVREGQPCV